MTILGRPPKQVSLHITIPSTDKGKLERLAKIEQLTLSAYLRRILSELLSEGQNLLPEGGIHGRVKKSGSSEDNEETDC